MTKKSPGAFDVSHAVQEAVDKEMGAGFRMRQTFWKGEACPYLKMVHGRNVPRMCLIWNGAIIGRRKYLAGEKGKVRNVRYEIAFYAFAVSGKE